ncbi:hypothetical protein FOA52_008252 [Chlamydomonas sp. UWO 241]|nr:hypothetical protein FOA52_008252 [Chlamydomonas sp. UWO 241]
MARGGALHLVLAITLVLHLLAPSEGLWSKTANQQDDQRLIGWDGDTYKPKSINVKVEVSGGGASKAGGNDRQQEPWVQVLAWSPRAFVYHNFLSKAEVKHILQLAAPQMKRSTVVGANNTGVVDSIRTSAGTFLMRNQDEVIKRVEQRLALWVQLPASHQEDMQVLRYAATNKYGAHMDGLDRVMSVLIYLVEPESGGETAFPNSKEWLHPEMGEPTQGEFSDCAKGHVAYKPKSGDALMFYDLKPDYKKGDGMAMHTGCPVVEGVKWNAVKWIHGKPFRQEEWDASFSRAPAEPLPDPGMCADTHEACERWATAGECAANPGFMLGSSSGRGACRRACKECEPCVAGDAACIAANRDKAGFLNLDPKEFKGAMD